MAQPDDQIAAAGGPRLAVLDVVGLTRRHLESGAMPRLAAFARRHGAGSFRETFPALTCPAQSTFLTGSDPSAHGIVGNGWFDRSLAEVHFWKQSNRLVCGKKIWHELERRRPGAAAAHLFWWYAMGAEVATIMTPRPMYPADGRKLFDIYTQPPELRFQLQSPAQLGPFPFHAFWGPRAGLASSAWIADAARRVEREQHPALSLVYLPHLDYPLQRHGPDWPGLAAELAAIDGVAGALAEEFEAAGLRVVVLSEYGITAVRRPVALNRLFREAGWIAIREELGRELLDPGASRVFAVADHQIAHIYVNDSRLRGEVRERVAACPEVEAVLDPADAGWEPGSAAAARAGDLLAVARPDAWFSYPYWLDDSRAPDFARTIDIHRKPGYDPCELFIDPALRWPLARVGWFLLKKKLGLRGLLELIPLDAGLVRGSHGRRAGDPLDQPVYLGPNANRVARDTDVRDALLELLDAGA
jgi:predicted AlkP superfamily pyrophosphatase or phosphodiesterase